MAKGNIRAFVDDTTEKLTKLLESTATHFTNVYAATFNGDLSGNATTSTTATNANNVNVQNDTSSTVYLLGATTTGNTPVYKESSVYITGDVLYANFNGNLSGNATTANSATTANTANSATTATTATNANNVNIQDDTTSTLYVLGAATTGNTPIYRESSVYMTGDVLYGAAWNDYAEYRNVEIIEPGRCVVEDKSGIMKISTERLQRGCELISDTFGFAIGKTDKCNTPIAVTGRVLAYTDKPIDTFELGAPVCSGPNGTISQMSEEEERLYPSRIIGTVSEIPTYDTWGENDIKVNGRIWIRIR